MALEARGTRCPADESYEDLLLRLFVDRVESSLGVERPCFVAEYPAPLASLARLKPGDASVAERFELYAGGLELANGFSELTDASEQRWRLEAERDLRRRLGREVYPLDERFIEAVGRMPPSAGVAVGLDRVLMLLTGSVQIRDVLLFPAEDFW
jgi:lysyl-tRNA synthetase class 2